MPFALVLSRCLLVSALCGSLLPTAVAQQPPPPPATPATTTDAQKLPAAPSAVKGEQQNAKVEPEKPAPDKDIKQQEQSKRIFGVVPSFGTTDRMDAPPLTSGEKFHLMRKATFDPVTISIAAFGAAISQAQDQFPDYHQGLKGYARRFGAGFADQASSQFFSNYLYPVLFKEDPRYFRLGHGSFGHRASYALKQEFICHTDKGGRSFNFSNVLGAFSSGGISNLYYPASDRGASLTLTRSATAVGYGSLGGLISEFWPDIQAKVLHRHKK